ncbi:MAG: folate family ECF transporter S component [Oscillospiraceae bacterium]|nr:folate family ECF transporter S component [Oscillospiraceae bacterium]
MLTQKNATKALAGQLRLFGNLRVLIIASLLIAMSIVFGKLLAFNIGPLRISFENLPLLMAGMFFGPLVGLVVGAAADLIGCMIVGYSINPIITLGAAAIGLVSGLVFRLPVHKNRDVRLVIAVFSAHILGSMVIKSVGLMVGYGYTIESVALRIPLYIGISIIESAVLFCLLRNKAFSSEIERVRRL